jgi:hypothetical protein
LEKKSCAICRGVEQQTKGINKKWLEGQCNISFEEISCKNIKKKREILSSPPTNSKIGLYIYDTNMIVKWVVIIVVVTRVVDIKVGLGLMLQRE